MDYLPIFVALHHRPVLVVGGNTVAERKIGLLLRSGAQVHVVAPELSEPLQTLQQQGRIHWRAREFLDSDLEGMWLVYSTSDDAELRQRVAEQAEARRILVNSVDDQAHCSFIMPAIVERSPVVVAISTGGRSPVLARRLRTAVERLLPQTTAQLARFIGTLRERINNELADFSQRRRFHEWLVDGPVAQAIAAGQPEQAQTHVEHALGGGQWASAGQVYLVGAGPGDPELLTLKGLQALQAADVIVHDGLVDPRVLDLARRDADVINVTKRCGQQGKLQERINVMLGDWAEQGHIVVRLKGGDPFIFGRGGEEIAYLRQRGIAYQVIPGITAAVGCAAYAGMPLTHRDHAHSVWLVTAHCRDSVDTLDWQDLAHSRQTLAFYMAVRHIAQVQQHLLAHGRDPMTPVALVENGCRPEQRVLMGRLDRMAALAREQGLQSPALLYIGAVAELAATLHWYGQAPIIDADHPAEQQPLLHSTAA